MDVYGRIRKGTKTKRKSLPTDERGRGRMLEYQEPWLAGSQSAMVSSIPCVPRVLLTKLLNKIVFQLHNFAVSVRLVPISD